MESLTHPWPEHMQGTVKVVTGRTNFVFYYFEKCIGKCLKAIQAKLRKEHELRLKIGTIQMRADMYNAALSGNMNIGEFSTNPDSVVDWLTMPYVDEAEEHMKNDLCQQVYKRFFEEIDKLRESMTDITDHMTKCICRSVISFIDSYRNKQQQEVRNIITRETDKCIQKLICKRYLLYKQQYKIQQKAAKKQVRKRIRNERRLQEQDMEIKTEKRIRGNITNDVEDLEKGVKEKLLLLVDKKEKELKERMTEVEKMMREERREEIQKQINSEMENLERKMRKEKREAVEQVLKDEMKEFVNTLKRKKKEMLISILHEYDYSPHVIEVGQKMANKQKVRVQETGKLFEKVKIDGQSQVNVNYHNNTSKISYVLMDEDYDNVNIISLMTSD